MELSAANDLFLPENRNGLVNKYTSYVTSIARKVKRSLSPQIELDDLVSYGMTGLFEAADRFDASRGANFTTFSYYRIRGAIYDGLRGMGWVSRNEYQKIRFEEKATAYLESANYGYRPANKGSEADLEKMASQVRSLITIFITSIEGVSESELIDTQTKRQDTVLERKEILQLLKTAVESLPQADQRIIKEYYFKEKSLEETGKVLGLSKSWTSRRHAQVIEKLSIALNKLLNPVEHAKKTIYSSG